MRINFVVNDVRTEEASFTTTCLAMTAVNMGHQSYYSGVGEFVYAPDGTIHGQAKSVGGTKIRIAGGLLDGGSKRRHGGATN